MVELVDTLDLKSNGHCARAGSSPASSTNLWNVPEVFLLIDNMATVYVLYSDSIDKFYTGSCNDLKKRLLQHQDKEFDSSFTRQATDWVLYFEIDKLDYQQERKIERHIKSMKSRKYIENLKKYPEIVDKLKRKYK